ncbi:hypothetical protein QMA77_23450 [Pantoea ananatis]|uniref:hypothetical protein n=1 Tax=Pantoea ananas TaxID=553 RepID=UPI0024AD391E|nr:hypothetical protein [Pantoea ananatis]MDI6539873.1 hypothetical protein [Pantoea ananatis]
MKKSSCEQHVRFFNGDDDTLIEASRLKVSLPNGEFFSIETRPGRHGSAILIIPNNRSDDSELCVFSINPGASNLFSVNVVRVRQDSDSEF